MLSIWLMLRALNFNGRTITLYYKSCSYLINHFEALQNRGHEVAPSLAITFSALNRVINRIKSRGIINSKYFSQT